jgi:MerR family copper efflux transcriptional regulator
VTLTRSAVARLAGVSPDTVRHYERKGVLPAPPRAANGYRRYPESAVARVQLVQRALAVGFTLSELARVLGQRDAGGAPCRHVHALVETRLRALDDHIASLTALRSELRDLLIAWDARLQQVPPGRQARLLDGLLEKPGIARAVRARFRR